MRLRRVARAKLCVLLVAACFSVATFAAGPLRAHDKLTEAQVNDINGPARTLETELAKLTAPAPAAAFDPEKLAALATLISRVVAATTAAKAWAANLNVLLATTKPDFLNEEFRAACMRLVEALSKLRLEERVTLVAIIASPGTDIPSNAAALIAALDKVRIVEGIPEGPTTAQNVDEAKLVKVAALISKLLDPTLAIALWANDLSQILADRKPDVDDSALRVELRKLLAALPKFEAAIGPRLNILQAYYGDAYYVTLATTGQLPLDRDTKTGRRVCDATDEVRTACQGKDSCPYVPTSGSRMALGGMTLCGSNIVAQASGNVAGVRIIYECLTVSKPEWDFLERSRRPRNPQDTPLQMWVRQGTAVTIRCAAELSPPK